MISWLSGSVLEISPPSLVLNVGGVGYEVLCSRACLGSLEPGTDAEVVVYTEVREDEIRLFGFLDKLERQVFRLLLKVKGVGARSAIALLSEAGSKELLRAIAEGDSGLLRSLKGIGKKTAERIIVELREQVGESLGEPSAVRHGASPLDASMGDARAALVALGFSEKDSSRAVNQVAQQMGSRAAELDAGEMVREALRVM